MATPPKKDKPTQGVRGPGGPSGRQPVSRQPVRSSQQSGSKSDGRRRLETLSMPVLRRISAMPRWLVVVIPAILLLLGLIQTGSLAWLGGILLGIVFLMILWLTALSWPVLSPGSKLIRAIIVAALLGITILKFAGRF